MLLRITKRLTLTPKNLSNQKFSRNLTNPKTTLTNVAPRFHQLYNHALQKTQEYELMKENLTKNKVDIDRKVSESFASIDENYQNNNLSNIVSLSASTISFTYGLATNQFFMALVPANVFFLTFWVSTWFHAGQYHELNANLQTQLVEQNQLHLKLVDVGYKMEKMKERLDLFQSIRMGKTDMVERKMEQIFYSIDD